MEKDIKDIDYYMSLPYHVEVTWEEDIKGYHFRCLELPGCETYHKKLKRGFEDFAITKQNWIEARLANNEDIPEPFPIDPVHV